jgi:microcystin-dependent protein
LDKDGKAPLNSWIGELTHIAGVNNALCQRDGSLPYAIEDVMYDSNANINMYKDGAIVSRGGVVEKATREAYGDDNTRGIIIPFYVYPTNPYTENSTVRQLCNLIRKYPAVPITVILNPGSGPGANIIPEYTQAITLLEGAGAKCIGYVATTHSNKNYREVIKQIKTWKKFYPEIKGIFFDEVDYQSKPESLEYYRKITDYARKIGVTHTIGNPGAPFEKAYIDEDIFDILIGYENAGFPDKAAAEQAWIGGGIDIPVSRRASLVHTAPSTFDAIKLNDIILPNFGWTYITADKMPNPWDAIDFAYLTKLIDGINGYVGGVVKSDSVKDGGNTVATSDAVKSLYELLQKRTTGTDDAGISEKYIDNIDDIQINSEYWISVTDSGDDTLASSGSEFPMYNTWGLLKTSKFSSGNHSRIQEFMNWSGDPKIYRRFCNQAEDTWSDWKQVSSEITSNLLDQSTTKAASAKAAFTINSKLDEHIENHPGGTGGGGGGGDTIIVDMDMFIGKAFPHFGSSDNIGTGMMGALGQMLQIEDYPKLYQQYGTSFGGDGVTTFRMPNLQGVGLRGHGQQEVNGRMKGSTLDVTKIWEDEIQRHSHQISHYNDAGPNISPAPATYSGTKGYSGIIGTKTDFAEGRSGSETHGTDMIVHWVIYVGDGSRTASRDTNIDQRVSTIENRLDLAGEVITWGWTDCSGALADRRIKICHKDDLIGKDLSNYAISIYYRHGATNKAVINVGAMQMDNNANPNDDRFIGVRENPPGGDDPGYIVLETGHDGFLFPSNSSPGVLSAANNTDNGELKVILTPHQRNISVLTDNHVPHMDYVQVWGPDKGDDTPKTTVNNEWGKGDYKVLFRAGTTSNTNRVNFISADEAGGTSACGQNTFESTTSVNDFLVVQYASGVFKTHRDDGGASPIIVAIYKWMEVKGDNRPNIPIDDGMKLVFDKDDNTSPVTPSMMDDFGPGLYAIELGWTSASDIDELTATILIGKNYLTHNYYSSIVMSGTESDSTTKKAKIQWQRDTQSFTLHPAEVTSLRIHKIWKMTGKASLNIYQKNRNIEGAVKQFRMWRTPSTDHITLTENVGWDPAKQTDNFFPTFNHPSLENGDEVSVRNNAPLSSNKKIFGLPLGVVLGAGCEVTFIKNNDILDWSLKDRKAVADRNLIDDDENSIIETYADGTMNIHDYIPYKDYLEVWGPEKGNDTPEMKIPNKWGPGRYEVTIFNAEINRYTTSTFTLHKDMGSNDLILSEFISTNTVSAQTRFQYNATDNSFNARGEGDYTNDCKITRIAKWTEVKSNDRPTSKISDGLKTIYKNHTNKTVYLNVDEIDDFNTGLYLFIISNADSVYTPHTSLMYVTNLDADARGTTAANDSANGNFRAELINKQVLVGGSWSSTQKYYIKEIKKFTGHTNINVYQMNRNIEGNPDEYRIWRTPGETDIAMVPSIDWDPTDLVGDKYPILNHPKLKTGDEITFRNNAPRKSKKKILGLPLGVVLGADCQVTYIKNDDISEWSLKDPKEIVDHNQVGDSGSTLETYANGSTNITDYMPQKDYVEIWGPKSNKTPVAAIENLNLPDGRYEIEAFSLSAPDSEMLTQRIVINRKSGRVKFFSSNFGGVNSTADWVYLHYDAANARMFIDDHGGYNGKAKIYRISRWMDVKGADRPTIPIVDGMKVLWEGYSKKVAKKDIPELEAGKLYFVDMAYDNDHEDSMSAWLPINAMDHHSHGCGWANANAGVVIRSDDNPDGYLEAFADVHNPAITRIRKWVGFANLNVFQKNRNIEGAVNHHRIWRTPDLDHVTLEASADWDPASNENTTHFPTFNHPKLDNGDEVTVRNNAPASSDKKIKNLPLGLELGAECQVTYIKNDDVGDWVIKDRKEVVCHHILPDGKQIDDYADGTSSLPLANVVEAPFTTGWTLHNDWTASILVINHKLGTTIDGLEVDFHVAPNADGTGMIRISLGDTAQTSSTEAFGSQLVENPDDRFNNLNINMAKTGIMRVDNAGGLPALDTEAWYYKVDVRKKTPVPLHAVNFQPIKDWVPFWFDYNNKAIAVTKYAEDGEYEVVATNNTRNLIKRAEVVIDRTKFPDARYFYGVLNDETGAAECYYDKETNEWRTDGAKFFIVSIRRKEDTTGNNRPFVPLKDGYETIYEKFDNKINPLTQFVDDGSYVVLVKGTSSVYAANVTVRRASGIDVRGSWSNNQQVIYTFSNNQWNVGLSGHSVVAIYKETGKTSLDIYQSNRNIEGKVDEYRIWKTPTTDHITLSFSDEWTPKVGGNTFPSYNCELLKNGDEVTVRNNAPVKSDKKIKGLPLGVVLGAGCQVTFIKNEDTLDWELKNEKEVVDHNRTAAGAGTIEVYANGTTNLADYIPFKEYVEVWGPKSNKAPASSVHNNWGEGSFKITYGINTDTEVVTYLDVGKTRESTVLERSQSWSPSGNTISYVSYGYDAHNFNCDQTGFSGGMYILKIEKLMNIQGQNRPGTPIIEGFELMVDKAGTTSVNIEPGYMYYVTVAYNGIGDKARFGGMIMADDANAYFPKTLYVDHSASQDLSIIYKNDSGGGRVEIFAQQGYGSVPRIGEIYRLTGKTSINIHQINRTIEGAPQEYVIKKDTTSKDITLAASDTWVDDKADGAFPSIDDPSIKDGDRLIIWNSGTKAANHGILGLPQLDTHRLGPSCKACYIADKDNHIWAWVNPGQTIDKYTSDNNQVIYKTADGYMKISGLQEASFSNQNAKDYNPVFDEVFISIPKVRVTGSVIRGVTWIQSSAGYIKVNTFRFRFITEIGGNTSGTVEAAPWWAEGHWKDPDTVS